MSEQLNIDDVARAFSQWRSNRKKLEPIPANLAKKVTALLNHYSPSLIAKRLRMSGRQIKRLSQSAPSQVKKTKVLSKTDFIPVVFPASEAKMSTVEVTISGQHQKQIVLKLGIEHLQKLLPQLMDKL